MALPGPPRTGGACAEGSALRLLLCIICKQGGSQKRPLPVLHLAFQSSFNMLSNPDFVCGILHATENWELIIKKANIREATNSNQGQDWPLCKATLPGADSQWQQSRGSNACDMWEPQQLQARELRFPPWTQFSTLKHAWIRHEFHTVFCTKFLRMFVTVLL